MGRELEGALRIVNMCVHRDDPEGWCGEGVARGMQDGEHVCTHVRFMWM